MSNDFVNGVLSEIDEVSDLKWLSENIVRITRDTKKPFTAGVLSKKQVSLADVSPLIDSGVSFVTNVPKAGLWLGEAIDACEDGDVAWGRLGALMSACAYDDEPERHEDRQVYFAVRAIRQHNRVTDLTYIYDKLFEVTLNNDNCLLVAVLQAYDLTADELRNARKKLGKFDIALKNNPNGRITSDAREAAEGMGIQVLGIGELLRHMGRGG